MESPNIMTPTNTTEEESGHATMLGGWTNIEAMAGGMPKATSGFGVPDGYRYWSSGHRGRWVYATPGRQPPRAEPMYLAPPAWLPHISEDENGHTTMEWWNGSRKLTLYAGDKSDECFLKSWGWKFCEMEYVDFDKPALVRAAFQWLGANEQDHG